MKLQFRIVASGIAVSFIALALALMVAPELLLSRWGLEVSLSVGVMSRRAAALLVGLAVMIFLARNAEPSSVRNAMTTGLVVSCLMLAALGSLELALGHVAPGILVAVFMEVVFALALLSVRRGPLKQHGRPT